MKSNKYIGRFKFDTETNQCWWLKENGEVFEVPKENKGMGKIAYQSYFALEKEVNPSHWVNYQQTFSKGSLWLRLWYKKAVGEQVNHYKTKIEKITNPQEVEFTEDDEIVKQWSEKKQKEIWVKKNIREKLDDESSEKLKKEIDELNEI